MTKLFLLVLIAGAFIFGLMTGAILALAQVEVRVEELREEKERKNNEND